MALLSVGMGRLAMQWRRMVMQRQRKARLGYGIAQIRLTAQSFYMQRLSMVLHSKGEA